ncbi:MAG: sigma-70 family RNA polymerase sigma factor [Phycisphaeraceae bacterium]
MSRSSTTLAMSQTNHNLPERDFAKLLVQHQPKLTMYFRTFVFRRSDIEDLTQEAAAKAWEQLGTYDPTRPFEPWLLTIAKFELLSYLRDHKRSRLVFSEALVDQLSDTLAEMQGKQELPALDALEQCLSRVPNDDRELLRQRFELDKTGQAIAEALQLSGATVSRRLQRIYSQLLLCVRQAMREGASQ